MLNHFKFSLRTKSTAIVYIGCTVALIIILLFAILQMPQHTPSSLPSVHTGLTLQVDIGFNSTLRVGANYWTPVHVALISKESDFTGTLSVRIYSGPPRSETIGSTSPWSFDAPVILSKGIQKQLTLNMPFYIGNFNPQGVVASLLDNHGKAVATKIAASGYDVKPGNLFIGMLTETSTESSALNNVSLPNQTSSLTFAPLDASTMPTQSAILTNFNCIILDNFASNTLQPAQIAALQTWINQGGVLIEVGGSTWQRTVGSLPADLLPVTINGITTLPAGKQLLPINGSAQQPGVSNILQDPLPVSTAVLRTSDAFSDNEVLLASDTLPLIARTHQGKGAIYYLAFDPFQAPLSNWAGIGEIWKQLLLHAFGDKLLIPSTALSFNTGPGDIVIRGGILPIIGPETPAIPWIIVVLLVAYLAVLGPLRLWLIRRLKLPRWWSWRIFVASIVLFSLLSYALAFYQKGAALINNSISLVQINQGGSLAHITTYSGVYVPSNGDFTLQMPGENLALPISNRLQPNNNPAFTHADEPAAIATAFNAVDLGLQDAGPWTFHPVVTEQDRHLQGGLVAHLSLNSTMLVGTIANYLNTDLSDAYVMLPQSLARIGTLAAGETRQVHIALTTVSPLSGKTLADHIAEQGGLATPYFPYLNNQQPHNDFQRHMALLAALNGSGSSSFACNSTCNTHAIADRGTLFVTGGLVPNPLLGRDYNTLLAAGTSATLIGWTNQHIAGTDDITINGSHAGGRQESLVQMPLKLAIANPLNIPRSVLAGHIVDIQSYDAQTALPGLYTLSNGGVTFEFTVPDDDLLQSNRITILVPDLITTTAADSHLQTRIYNWRTGIWDAAPLVRDAFSTIQTFQYIGTGGRVLLYVSSQPGSKIYFSKPYLNFSA